MPGSWPDDHARLGSGDAGFSAVLDGASPRNGAAMSHIDDMATPDLLRVFAAKAPVRVLGAQQQAHRARAILGDRGIALPPGIDTAISHALTGEGRGEFDDLMREVL